MWKAMCPICQTDVNYLVMHLKAEEQLIEILKKDHPDWVEGTGLCPKCLEYYRQELERHKRL